jgi:hypothetical protein
MTTPQAHTSGRRDRQLLTAKVGSAAQAFGGLEPGAEVFALTHGQFSLIDALVYLSNLTGPCDLSVCTWTAGTKDLQHMASLLAAGRFRSVRWLVDRSFITRQPAYCRTLRELFGDDCIRTTRSHAKFVTMRNETWDLAIRTSMNLNHNPRMECIEVSDDPALADFIDSQFDLYFTEQDAGTFDAELHDEQGTLGLEVGRVSANRIYPE